MCNDYKLSNKISLSLEDAEYLIQEIEDKDQKKLMYQALDLLKKVNNVVWVKGKNRELLNEVREEFYKGEGA